MTTIAHNVTLNRYPLNSNPDSVGTIALWERPVHEIYAQMPFRGLFSGLTVESIHIDTPEGAGLKERNAAGLAWSGGMRLIQFSVSPTRIPEQAVLTFSHEFGHFYQFECRLDLYGSEADDITRKIREQWDLLRPQQGHNAREDWAEVCRAVFGADAVRGTYSDNKRAEISPQLRSLIRCAYWLSLSLRGAFVNKITPLTNGVQYCVWDESKLPDVSAGKGWRWRWISEKTFQSQEWDGKNWRLV